MRAFQIAALVETAVRDERKRGIIRSKALEDAARQALEALERYNGCLTHFHEPIEYNNAITALRAALRNKFNPDWDQVEALQESLREHMAEIQRLRAALAEPKENP